MSFGLASLYVAVSQFRITDARNYQDTIRGADQKTLTSIILKLEGNITTKNAVFNEKIEKIDAVFNEKIERIEVKIAAQNAVSNEKLEKMEAQIVHQNLLMALQFKQLVDGLAHLKSST